MWAGRSTSCIPWPTDSRNEMITSPMTSLAKERGTVRPRAGDLHGPRRGMRPGERRVAERGGPDPGLSLMVELHRFGEAASSLRKGEREGVAGRGEDRHHPGREFPIEGVIATDGGRLRLAPATRGLRQARAREIGKADRMPCRRAE
jgi:hypothetical protein